MRSSWRKNVSRKITVSILIMTMLYGTIAVQSEHVITANIVPNSDVFPDSNELLLSENSVDTTYYSLNDYNPITNVSNPGSSFTARDRITVDHELSLNLTYDDIDDKFASDYTIDPLTGFSAEFLYYGITEVRAKRDNYTIENLFADEQVIIDPIITIAQGFEIPWSNATFYGAYLNLDLFGTVSHTGLNVLELLLVKAEESTGKPNMSNIISSDVNDPYNTANPLPSPGSTSYYDFTNVLLEQGFYFIVANLTERDPTSQKKFMWRGHLKSSGFGGDTYYRNDSFIWSSLISIDHTMIVDILPSNASGSAMVFTDLTGILLEDNSVIVNTFTDSISSTGLHHITSDTSIEIDLVNRYTFYDEKTASSTYQAFNSSFDSYSILWNFTWNIGYIDYSPYSNLNRTQLLIVPTDWNDVFTANYNLSSISIISKNVEGYLLQLGNNTEPGVIDLYTSSPNYVQQLTLSDGSELTEEFTLGYWTNDGINAYGYEGDTIFATLNIKNNEISGVTNFTLFNPVGSILPIKTSFPSNLSYTDSSSYSHSGITSSGLGIFTSDISLDPSVYGSDPVGYWTAFVFWENGTEIGIYSIRISVHASIIFNASWETLPSNDIWTNDDSQTILRRNGDALNVKASFFSNSEPFFTEFGSPVENASIGYLTSWNLEGYLDEYPLEFSGAIPILTTAGLRTVTLVLNDSWSIQEMVDIQIEIFNVYSILPVQQSIETNTSEEVILAFSVINETDPTKGSILPDTISLKINNNPVSSDFYSVSNQSSIVYVTVKLADYGITSGKANITLDITKENFKSSYIDEAISVSFSVEITASAQLPLPLYAIIIIAVAAFMIITIIAIMAIAISYRKRPAEIMDIQDKSKVVGLLDSVLAMKKVLILHTETSLPIFEVDIGEKSFVESTLVSGFLAALTQMGKTISGTEAGEIKKLEYRNFVVNSARSDTYTLFLFSTEDIIKEVQVRLFDLIMWFEYSFQIKEDMWDGRVEMFQKKRHLIQDKVADSLYIWLYFPLKFNQSKAGEIKKLEKNDVRIALYMKKKEQAAISELLTKFHDSPMEDTLTSVFKLVNKGILERMQFSSFTG